MYSQWSFQKEMKNNSINNPNWLEIIEERGKSFNYLVIVSLQTINTQKKVGLEDKSSFFHNNLSTLTNGNKLDKKFVILELNEIVCFPFIVLELVNESPNNCGVNVYDQQQILVSPNWSSTVSSFTYAPNLMQCIRRFDEYVYQHFTSKNKSFSIVTENSHEMEVILRREAESKGINLASYFDRYFSIEKEFNKMYNSNAKGLKEMCQVLGFNGISSISGMEACKIMSNIVALIVREGVAFRCPTVIDYQNDPWESVRASIQNQLKQNNEDGKNKGNNINNTNNENEQDSVEEEVEISLIGRPRKSTLESDGKNSASGNKKDNILHHGDNILGNSFVGSHNNFNEGNSNVNNNNNGGNINIVNNINNNVNSNVNINGNIIVNSNGNGVVHGNNVKMENTSTNSEIKNNESNNKENSITNVKNNANSSGSESISTNTSNGNKSSKKNNKKNSQQQQQQLSNPGGNNSGNSNFINNNINNGGGGNKQNLNQINNIQNLQPKKNFQKKEPTRAIKLRGLPWNVVEEDIHKFFDGIKRGTVTFTFDHKNRPTGEAYIVFETVEDCEKAREYDKRSLGSRYIEIFRTTEETVTYVKKRFNNKKNLPPEKNQPQQKTNNNNNSNNKTNKEDSINNTNNNNNNNENLEGNILVTIFGMPYSTSFKDLEIFFDGFNFVKDSIKIELDTYGKPNGHGSILFSDLPEAQRALKEKNKQFIGKRYVKLAIKR
eukprot:TRINITY_DN4086_c0_g1_i1.p1 TRINITY_DN4086_c0_g1~~TRINITY_DN4086_c0_g1_i1.p1  ORF type:complete len:721 (+),score=231.82 TRINITY_DN4086_c0_g1_i1:378-2540(+)